jgi:hypothetical protein
MRVVYLRGGVTVAVVALLMAGCADAPAPSRHEIISRSAWRQESNAGAWPFTVDEGVLACHAPDWVTFSAGGTEYALSDSARWIGRFPSVAPIRSKGYVEIGDVRQPVPMSLDAVTDRGRELCE